MNASEIAKHAAGLVSGDRHEVHGDKHVTFDRIVRLWNAYLQCRFGIGAPTITPLDAAQMMSLLKKARAMSGAYNPDDYVDDVGYAAIAGELAGHEPKRRTVRSAPFDPWRRDPMAVPGDAVTEVSQQERELKAAMREHDRVADAIQRRQDTEGDVEP